MGVTSSWGSTMVGMFLTSLWWSTTVDDEQARGGEATLGGGTLGDGSLAGAAVGGEIFGDGSLAGAALGGEGARGGAGWEGI